MSEATTATAEEVVVPDTVAELVDPTFEVIEPNAARTCDRHPQTYALVLVTLPNGGTLELCGNCGRRNFGYEHVKAAKQENRQKGSAS
jgi:hypothetical protein